MSNPTQQIKACLADEEAYRKGRKPIIQQITNGNLLYSDALVEIVKEALKNKKEKAIPKFISLYFLKEAVDTQDPQLVYSVKDKLLKTLAELAKSETNKIFPSGTEDKILKNFDQLLLECIIFWAEWFGKDTKGKPTKFKTTADEVFQKVEMPKKFSFFTKKKKPAADSPPAPAPDSSKGQSGSTVKPPEKAPGSEKDLRGGPPSSGGREEKSKSSKTPTPTPGGGKDNVDANKIEETLKSMDGIKDLLIGTLTEDKPDSQMLMLVEDQIREMNRDLQNALNTLLGQESSKNEALLNRVLEDSNFASKYLDEYSRLQTGQISMQKFKDVMMNAAMSSKEKNSPRKEKKKDKDTTPKPTEKPPKSQFAEKPKEPEPKAFDHHHHDPYDHHHHSSSPAVPKDNHSPGFNDFGSSAPKPKIQPPEQNSGSGFGGYDSAPAPNKKKVQFDDGFGSASSKPKDNPFGEFNSAQSDNDFRPTFGKKDEPKKKDLSIKPPDSYDPYESKYDTREETKAKENPFNSMWDQPGKKSGPKKPEPKKDDGFGFDDFGEYKFGDSDRDKRGNDMDSSQVGGFNFDYDGGIKRSGTPNSVTAQDIFGEADFSKGSPRKDDFNFASPKTDPYKKNEFGLSSFEPKYQPKHEHKPQEKNDFKPFSSSVPKTEKTEFGNDFGSFKDTKPKPEKKNYFENPDTEKPDSTFKGLTPPPKSSVLDKLGKIDPYKPSKLEPTAFESEPFAAFSQPPTTSKGAFIATSTVPMTEADRLRQESEKLRSELGDVRKQYDLPPTFTSPIGREPFPTISPPRRTPSPPVMHLSEVMTGMTFSPANTAIENARRARGEPVFGRPGLPLGEPILESRLSPPRSYLGPSTLIEPRISPPRSYLGPSSLIEPRISPSRSYLGPSSLIEPRISPSRSLPPTYLSSNPSLHIGEPFVGARLSPARVVSPRPPISDITQESVHDIARRVREQVRPGAIPVVPVVSHYPVAEPVVATRIVTPLPRPVEPAPVSGYMRSPALNAVIEEARRNRELVLSREHSTPLPPPTEVVHVTHPVMVPTRVLSSPPHVIAEEVPAVVLRENHVKPSIITGMNFVPKYSTTLPQPVQFIPVERVEEAVPAPVMVEQVPVVVEPQPVLMPQLPDKYLRLGQPPQVLEERFSTVHHPAVQATPVQFVEHAPQEVVLTRVVERPEHVVTRVVERHEPVPQVHQTAWKKTSDLIERARRMRADVARNSVTLNEPHKEVKIFSSTIGPAHRDVKSFIEKDPIIHPHVEGLYGVRKPSPLKRESVQALQNSTNLAQTLKNDPRVWNTPGQVDTVGFDASRTNPRDYAKENIVNPVEQRVIHNVVTQKIHDNVSQAPGEQPEVSKYSKFYPQSVVKGSERTSIEERKEIYSQAPYGQGRLQGLSGSFQEPQNVGTIRRVEVGAGRGVQENALEREDARVRQMIGVPATNTKVAVSDSYFQPTPTSFAREQTPVKGVMLEERAQKGLTGKKDKLKIGKAMAYDNDLFDQFINLIYGYPAYRDIDAFKYACLMNRATLFESPALQLTSFTKIEGPAGPSDDFVKAFIHYTNKSATEISNFAAFTHDTSVKYTPQIKGATLTPRYQLKQEFLINYHDLNCGPYVVDVSYRHEGQTKQMNLVIPVTIAKFMKFKRNQGRASWKSVWKQLKPNAVSIGYRKVNAKFLRSPTEINAFFENLCDITPAVNPKNKKKYGGIFVLPDNREYYIKFTLDLSRVKITGCSGEAAGGAEELVIQYLAFLLTI